MFQKILIWILVISLGGVMSIFISDRLVEHSTSDNLYNTTTKIP